MKTITPSATLAINEMARKKQEAGEKVYNFAAGDPILKTHPKILEKVQRRLENPLFPYPPVGGIHELRALAANWMNATYNTSYKKEQVLVTSGGKFAIFALVYALANPGDEVLIIAPYWVSYPEIVKIAGATPKILPTTEKAHWKIRGNDLAQYATQKTRFLLFNNGSNPSGALYTRKEIEEILIAAKELGIMVISDEVYSGLTYDGNAFISLGSFPAYVDSLAIVQSCSKNFGMTGWRVGFALAPTHIINTLMLLDGQTTTGVPTITQFAALGALEHAQEVQTYLRDNMHHRRNLFVDTYNALFTQKIEKPPSTIYSFISLAALGVTSSISSISFCEQLIASENVAAVPGEAFGAPGYVRFAFSIAAEEIARGVEALHAFVKRSFTS